MEIRNNLVGMTAFVATLILAILATTSNPSLENAIVDIIRTNSAIILGADIIFAVGSFIGINLFTLAVGKQYSVMVEGYQTVLITITALSDFINRESLDIVSIKPNQLRVFSQFIRIAVNGNRIKLFDAFKQASTRKFFSPLTKGAYRNAALLQLIEMDLVYDVYSSYRDELFKEREFLKEYYPF